jgi:uncharacterized protein
MKRGTTVQLFKRSVIFFTGIFIITFGVSLTIKANIGTGAWDALHVGLYESVGLTVGRWLMITGTCLMLLNAFLLKEKPQFLALGTIFVIGMFIDFWLLFVFSEWTPSGQIVKLIVLLCGIIIISFGVALYLQAKFPVNPIDQLMIAIHKRFKVTLMAAKTIGEVFGLSLALLVGGPIGIGTLIITFTIGPLVGFFFPLVEKWTKMQ